MTEMTSRERLLAACRHAPVDRVPCSPRVWAWLLATYGSDSIENNLALADRFGYDPHFVISVFEHPSDLLSFQSRRIDILLARSKNPIHVVSTEESASFWRSRG